MTSATSVAPPLYPRGASRSGCASGGGAAESLAAPA